MSSISEDVFDLNLNLIRDNYIPSTRDEIVSSPKYFKDAALLLIKSYYPDEKSRQLVHVIHDLNLSSINTKIYNCLYFLNLYSKGKFKICYDNYDNLILNYKNFKKWNSILLSQLYIESSYFDD